MPPVPAEHALEILRLTRDFRCGASGSYDADRVEHERHVVDPEGDQIQAEQCHGGRSRTRKRQRAKRDWEKYPGGEFDQDDAWSKKGDIERGKRSDVDHVLMSHTESGPCRRHHGLRALDADILADQADMLDATAGRDRASDSIKGDGLPSA